MHNIKLIITIVTSFIVLQGLAQSRQADISLFILDDKVWDNYTVTAIVKNDSPRDYWFPIDTSELAYNAVLFGDYQALVYTIEQNVFEEPSHIKAPLVANVDFDADKLLDKWKQQLVIKKVEDFLIVPANSYVSIKLPLTLRYKFSPSFYQLSDDSKVLSYSLSYHGSKIILKKVLGEALLQQVKNKGYYIYPFALVSNSVPLLIEN